MSAAEDEYVEFAQWLRDPSTRGFKESLHRRTVDTYLALLSNDATPVELGVLVRQHARRWPKRGTVIGDVIAKVIEPALDALDLSVHENDDGAFLVTVRPWMPEWAGRSSVGLPEDGLDAASQAGSATGLRQKFDAFKADPAFVEATGWETYRTPGQRSAVRIALEGRPGGFLLTCLPTGSGKTEVAVTLARKANKEGKTSLLVVPTTALAYDLERRLRETWSKHAKGDLSDVPFAWTAATSDAHKEDLTNRVQSGSQPVLITSPESLTTRLMSTVRSAAGAGRIGALVIDEAHLVTQWGMGFRPQYRLLGDLWRDLNRRCPDGQGVRALLMSATYSRGVVDDLLHLFLAGTEMEPDFVVANELRPEPDFFVADVTTVDERDSRVVEAARRLPRPAIVYVTQPKRAEQLAQRLRDEGFKRLAVVSGDTSDAKRRDAMTGLRTDDGSSRFDLIVATSAFGLGVDCPEVRAVVHACLPESPDRWYQELGRGGRDGHRSSAILLPAHGDRDEAASLGLRALTPEVAASRWEAMWDRREDDTDGKTYVCLAASPAGSQDGSYNRRWNQQLLDGLQSTGVLRADVVAWDDLLGLELEWRADTPPNLPPAWFRITLHGPPPDPGWFDVAWIDWKERLEHEDELELALMGELVSEKHACAVLRRAYSEQRDEFASQFPDIARGLGVQVGCGRCQACRVAGVASFAASDRPEAAVRCVAPTDSPFARVVTGHPFTGARAIGLECEYLAVAVGDVAEHAEALRAAGARLFVGPDGAPAAENFAFRDHDTDLEWLTPIPAVVQVDEVESVEPALVGLSLRPEPVGPVLLVVPDIPRSVRSTAPLHLADLVGRMQ